MEGFRADHTGFYIHKNALTAAVWKKLTDFSKVAPVLNAKSPAAKRRKGTGPVLGKSFSVIFSTSDGGDEWTWIPRTWIETMPELIRFRSAVQAFRESQLAHTGLQTSRTCGFTLKPAQCEVLSEVFSYSGITSGCLALHTGFGKTVVAMELIARFGVRTLWLSHTTQLLKQSADRAQTILGATVGSLTDDDMGGSADIVTCTIQSLLRRDFPPEVLSSFGLLVVDEVHHMSAPSFSQALHKVGGIPRMIGLSATLERKDGLEKVFQWTIGQILSVRTLEVKIIPKVLVFQKGWEVEIKLGRGGDPIFAQAITDMARLEDYNQTICKVLKHVFASETFEQRPLRKILVLTDRKEHVLILHAKLTADADFAGIVVGTLHGDMSEKAIEDVFESDENIQILLGTYGICGEGFDWPGLNAVVMATPRNDIRQAVGRVLGERVGALRPLIVDIRNTMGIFYNQGRERVKFYKESGFDVEIKKVTPSMFESATVADELDDEPDEVATAASAGAGGAGGRCVFVDDE
jgi:superfamily II DNA or RNA helicase